MCCLDNAQVLSLVSNQIRLARYTLTRVVPEKDGKKHMVYLITAFDPLISGGL